MEKIKEKIKEKLLPFELEDDQQSKKIKIGIENKDNIKTYFYPEHISAIILRKIKEDPEYFLSKKANKTIIINKVVIAFPANFNQNQRKATKQAAEVVNLEVISMINEPTAASLEYDLHKFDKENEEKRIIILDLGSGTLDFTLLMFKKNDNGIYCDVEGSYSYPNFGGEDFDITLLKEIIKNKNNFNKEK